MDDLTGAEIRGTSLRGARIVDCDVSGLVMRGVYAASLDVDAPWLVAGETPFLVNGVDVTPHVQAELDRRFPGRDQRRAAGPEALAAAWAVLQQAWAAAVDRVAGLPDGAADAGVDGEWSFAQTLRHLVFATDAWLGRGVLGEPQPFHPLGLGGAGTEADRLQGAQFVTGTPAYADVLAARAERVAAVGGFVAGVTPERLAEPARNPWSDEWPETVLSCLHTILEEEWEHLRYALRDLDALGARAGDPGQR